MLKETETEETIGFFVVFLSLVAFRFGGAQLLCLPIHLATLMKLAMIVETCLPFRWGAVLQNRSYCYCCRFFFSIWLVLLLNCPYKKQWHNKKSVMTLKN